MTADPPDRAAAWRRVNEVFHRALELPSAERAAFVQHECANMTAICVEVLSLLEAHDRTAQFLAEPAAGSAGHTVSPAAGHRLDTIVGQYRLAGILGEGGMGVVYQAEDLRLGRIVALKAISSAVAGDPVRRERLRREARTAAALSHPGIATVYALEEFGDDLFIAGEFVAGETLREEVGRGPVDPGRVLDTAIEFARALSAAHDRGVIHRDLKPENVIRTPSGHVKILDFGLARMRDLPPELAQLTSDGKVFGTPAYMSPEQIRNEHVDARSDLFSLGILLYELLAGAHPFGAADPPTMIARILGTAPTPLSANGGGTTGSLRQGLEGIVGILLQKSPAARFASAHELLAALKRVRAGEVGHASGPVAFAAHALWWWKFHQAATSACYALLLVPTWLARHRLDNGFGSLVFLAAVVAVVAATTLRMHLWFAADSMPGEWPHQYARSWKWLRAADVLLVVALVTAGIAVLNEQSSTAVVLVTGGVLVMLCSAIIEPATTRAAFGLSSRNGPGD